MRYSEFEDAMSVPRIQRYLNACAKNTHKTMRLYRANIRLSQELFAVLNIFEVVLRNAIDKHYRHTLVTDKSNLSQKWQDIQRLAWQSHDDIQA